MYLLGYDLGSSSIKTSLIDTENGEKMYSDFFPKNEMTIFSQKTGWAEQDPDIWWENLKLATQSVIQQAHLDAADIAAIGISYQMHGLVLVDKNQKVLRPSIIWCDSRATKYGDKAFKHFGEKTCLKHLLNSPGNFTAAKLAWVKEKEPDLFEKAYKALLPGDYIAMRLTGEFSTTLSGLSEAVCWDFTENQPAKPLLDYFGFPPDLIPKIYPNFSNQGTLNKKAAEELGLKEGTPICYRAGDQPNNALSLNVLNPGEVAATAGTSGVVYGISDKPCYDPYSRVNCFAHVNHSEKQNRIGVLLCINGTGILNSWITKMTGISSYEEANKIAAQAPIGSDGLFILPFGNGTERILEDQPSSCSIFGIQFNRHSKAHLLRAAQEGIVYALAYGMEILNDMGIQTKLIRAGRANMFLNPIFRDTFAGVTDSVIELYDTNGSIGAARGAGIGAGIFKDSKEAFSSLKKIETIEPNFSNSTFYKENFAVWKSFLRKKIGGKDFLLS